MNNKRDNQSSHQGQGTQGGSHEQHVKAGHLGGSAPHSCRGRECSEGSQGSSSSSRSEGGRGSEGRGTQGGSHEQHVKAGHLGGSAPHACRGRECSEE